ncbi:MAG TPA: hypothetical protein VIM71_11915, partial [Lacunisphaera sp.]
MLKILLSWLDHHSPVYWVIVAGPTLLLLWRIVSQTGSWTVDPAARPPRNSWKDGLIIFLFLFAW